MGQSTLPDAGGESKGARPITISRKWIRAAREARSEWSDGNGTMDRRESGLAAASGVMRKEKQPRAGRKHTARGLAENCRVPSTRPCGPRLPAIQIICNRRAVTAGPCERILGRGPTSPWTTKLDDRRQDQPTLDKFE
jgi:hypothetical protein